MNDPAESLRPVRIALLVFACLLPVVGCLRRQAEPPPTPLVAAEALADGEAPVRRIPAKPLEWQKTPPCDADKDEHAVNGACYQRTGRSPKDPGGCGAKLLEHDTGCYRAIAKAPREPTSIRR
jgi:hypothetical protein